jgi:membrane protein YqaA with SNARE-associated domain
MRSFSKWIITLCATPAGVVVLAALDSTLFFSLPFGIDAAVIILAARMRDLWWTVPLLASAGSVGGAALTFWMGKKIGENGLERYVPPKRLKKVRARINQSGAIALAVLDLIPPPFPFTPFVLAAGALEVKTSLFFVTLTVCRIIRFGIEAALAARHGNGVLAWLESDLFHDVVSFFIVIAVVLTALSIVKLIHSTRGRSSRKAKRPFRWNGRKTGVQGSG